MHGIVCCNALRDLAPFICLLSLLALEPTLSPKLSFVLVQLDVRLLGLVLGQELRLLSIADGALGCEEAVPGGFTSPGP